VWYLLMYGELPESHERHTMLNRAFSLLQLPQTILDLILTLPAGSDFMAELRSSMSIALSAWGVNSTVDLTPEQIQLDCFRAAAVAPAVVAAVHRLRIGLEPVSPVNHGSWAANYLYLLTGEVPSETQVRALDRYLILVADHGLNASTFAARSVISTGTDVGSAVVAAIGALRGPLHGGAPSRVLEMFYEIGDASNTSAWTAAWIEAGMRIMGFGHRVYKTYDPRARLLRQTAQEINAPLADYAATVEEAIISTFKKLKPGREISTNVEYWSAVVMEAIGLSPALFTPTFFVSRMVGWTAHIKEQLGNNRIVRPRAEYNGPELRDVP
jgi:citrate synthase